MNELFLILTVALFGATVLITILCAGTGYSLSPTKRRRIAKLCRALGLAVFGVGLVGVIACIILSVGATAAPGLSEADRVRMLSNGLAEAARDAVLSLIFGIPALLVARRALRER